MNRKPLAVRLAIVLGILGALVFGAYFTVPGIPPQPDPVTNCRPGDPLAGVYWPWRLQVLDPCLTVTGVVTMVEQVPDLDYHVNVLPDPPYRNLLNTKNVVKQSGTLIVEIVPADQKRFAAPAVGGHVEITGAYVLDRVHGWMEIHPVWRIRVLNK